MSQYEHLISNCQGNCMCSEPVKQGPNGNWFITMGHAGFNTPTNNGEGYKTRVRAIQAFKKYARR